MAKLDLRRTENVAGDFYVDSTCIDCDTCRWMAPETFNRGGEQSRVYKQPRTTEERDAALLALVSCPTSSIGTQEKHPVAEVAKKLPSVVHENVYHCGYHDKSSFGAASYLIVRPEGNVLIDSPRFAAPLVRRLEELGGVKTLFLTHRDDVGDHARFHEHFGCERILHSADANTDELKGVERLIEGEREVDLDDELIAIPMPGHTEGSMCLLYKDTYMFTGDHLAWNGELGHLYAFREACWFDWETQSDSMRDLAAHEFEWVLPGHGRRKYFEREMMRWRMEECIAWMEE